MYKLPVWQTIKDGLGFIWTEKRAWFDYALIPIIVATAAPMLLGLLLVGTPIIGLASEAEINSLFQDLDFMFFAAIALGVLVSVWLYVAFAVAWHRRYLLGPQNTSARELIQWSRRHWIFVGRGVGYFVLLAAAMIPLVFVLNLILASLIIALGPAGPVLVPVIVFALFLFVVVQIVGLSLAFPAAAIEDSELGLIAAWKLARGNRWRMCGIIVFGTIVPTFIIQLILLAIVSAILIAVGLTADTSVTPSIAALVIIELVSQAISFLGIAIGVSMLSIMYRRLRDNLPLDAKETA
ncbi:MAG: hypothetical protein ABJ215_14060 [Alphaproteobacteria bacterium]